MVKKKRDRLQLKFSISSMKNIDFQMRVNSQVIRKQITRDVDISVSGETSKIIDFIMSSLYRNGRERGMDEVSFETSLICRDGNCFIYE